MVVRPRRDADCVRNRLTRLVGSGMIERRSESGHREAGPGTPIGPASEAHKRLGQNYADLAVALWGELMSGRRGPQAPPAPLRPGDRTPGGPVSRGQVRGEGLGRPGWSSLGTILHDRGIEAEVHPGGVGTLPILRQHSCPYFALARSPGRLAPWSGRCSRRSSARPSGSASAGSTAIAPATSRPSRSSGRGYRIRFEVDLVELQD